jgi:hypothetical protein
MRFGELFRMFPDAIILGLCDKTSGHAVLNPSPDSLLGPHDALIMMRPTSVAEVLYKPLKEPLAVDAGGFLASALHVVLLKHVQQATGGVMAWGVLPQATGTQRGMCCAAGMSSR